MRKEDGGLARYSIDCKKGIDWEKARAQGVENRLRQRKVREGIESLRAMHSRKKVLDSFEPLITWRLVFDKYFDKYNLRTHTCAV